jgi:hypothetical protein
MLGPSDATEQNCPTEVRLESCCFQIGQKWLQLTTKRGLSEHEKRDSDERADRI